MDISIKNSKGQPIYEQITAQIKGQIIAGKLKEGDMLPSMRGLAKELRISVITTKRAYDELEREGFIISLPGKGSFVTEKNIEFVREGQLREIESLLEQAVDRAISCGVGKEELMDMLRISYEEK